MKYLSRLVISLALVLAGVVIASPVDATAFPSNQVRLLWLSDDDPSIVGHQAALNVSVSGLTGVDGTFYVYEGISVPQSGTPIATLAINGAGDNELFTTTSNVGAASRYSVKFVSNNASYSNTNFENIRLTCSTGRYSDSGFGPCLYAPQATTWNTKAQLNICHVHLVDTNQTKEKCSASMRKLAHTYRILAQWLRYCVPSAPSRQTQGRSFAKSHLWVSLSVFWVPRLLFPALLVKQHQDFDRASAIWSRTRSSPPRVEFCCRPLMRLSL